MFLIFLFIRIYFREVNREGNGIFYSTLKTFQYQYFVSLRVALKFEMHCTLAFLCNRCLANKSSMMAYSPHFSYPSIIIDSHIEALTALSGSIQMLLMCFINISY